MNDSPYICLDYASGGFTDDELLTDFVHLHRKFPWNPHGVTEFSELSRQEIIRAKNRLFSALEIPESEARIVWTATGTEALNLAVTGFCATHPNCRIACNPAVHHGLLRPVEKAGRVTWDVNGEADLTCEILVNNETGAIADIPQKSGALILDASQAIGKIPFSWRRNYPAELTILSGKKLGTPMQIGALIIKNGTDIAPQILGGGQQNGLRSGTLDSASCAVFAQAVENAVARQDAFQKQTAMLRQKAKDAIRQLQTPHGAPVFFEATDDAHQCDAILMMAIPGLEGALVARILAHDYGILVGTGSACSAETGETSHVLKSMGIPEELARYAIRISFNHDTSCDHIDALAEALQKTIDNF